MELVVVNGHLIWQKPLPGTRKGSRGKLPRRSPERPPEGTIEEQKAWRKERKRIRDRQYYHENRRGAIMRAKDKNLRRDHKINLRQYADMLVHQGGRCAICGELLDCGPNTHLDHDHATGCLRGILCRSCNLLLGRAHDDPAILAKAIEYLERQNS